MADGSKIEWTESTWNPVVGCTKVSPGCDNCYAETFVNRFAGRNKGFPNRFDVVTLRDDRMLTQPIRWKRGRRIFVNSLSDLFHADVPDHFIAEVFAVMALTPQHTYQVLTKRHGRMRSLLTNGTWRMSVLVAMEELRPYALDLIPLEEPVLPLPNVWLGVSVEDQEWADIRIPALLGTPAAVRFLSCEPLLGPLERLYLTEAGVPGVCYDIDGGWWHKPGSCPHCRPRPDWVIVGAESGSGARPMHAHWARTIKDACVDAGVPFFLKQYAVNGRKVHLPELDGQRWMQYPKIPPPVPVAPS